MVGIRLDDHVRVAVEERDGLVARPHRQRMHLGLAPRQTELQLVLARGSSCRRRRRCPSGRQLWYELFVLCHTPLSSMTGCVSSPPSGASSKPVPKWETRAVRNRLLPTTKLPSPLKKPLPSVDLIEGRLRRMRRAGAAAELRFLALVEREAAADGRRSPAPRPLRRSYSRIVAIRCLLDGQDSDVGLADRAPAPQVVLHDRAADLEAVVLVLVRPVALAVRASERSGQRRIHVVAPASTCLRSRCATNHAACWLPDLSTSPS